MINSTGFNVAEAMNFAMPDWLPKGMACVALYRKYHKTAVFSMQQVVIGSVHKVIRTNVPESRLSVMSHLLQGMRFSICEVVKEQLLSIIALEKEERALLSAVPILPWKVHWRWMSSVFIFHIFHAYSCVPSILIYSL